MRAIRQVWALSSPSRITTDLRSFFDHKRQSSRGITNTRTEIIPPALKSWISQISSRPVEVHHDTLDVLRATQLMRTLPTRQHLDDVHLELGDELVKGGHMVYFQPETMLKNLSGDGSSPVSPNSCSQISTPYDRPPSLK